MNIHSINTHSVAQSAYPELPLGQLPNYGELLERMFEQISCQREYDDFGNEIPGVDRLFADDFDWGNEINDDALRMTEKLMSTPFVMRENPKFPSEIKKAMNAHIVTGINVNLQQSHNSKDVLILNAGNGEDVVRVLHKGFNVRSIDMVGVTKLSNRASFAKAKFSGEVRRTTFNIEDVDQDKDFKLRDRYDVIIVHHGLHHTLQTRRGEEAFVKLLDRLSDDGLLLGDKVDLMGLDTLETHTNLPSHGIELLNYARDKCIEGMMTIRVMDTVWNDPVLTDKRIYDLVPPGYSVQLLQGQGAFDFNNNGLGGKTLSGRNFVPPSSVKHAAKTSSIRVMTYVEIRRGLKLPMVVDPGIPMEAGGRRWVDADFEDHQERYFDNFPVNRGRHFQARDISFLGEGYSMCARKGDGLRARVVIAQDGAFMQVETNPVSRKKMTNIHSHPGFLTLRLQCEYYPDSGFVELNDPIWLGPESPISFLSRLNMFDAIVRRCPWMTGIVARKRWYTSLHDAVIHEAGDEFVIMSASAPTPFERGGKFQDTAKFTKRRPTVDIFVGDKLCETYIDDGTVKRLRPDKVVQNSAQNIREVRDSIKLHDLLHIEQIEYDVELEKQDLLRIDWESGVTPSPGVVIALRYPNRHNMDLKADYIKMRLLASVGYAPPRRNLEFRGVVVDDGLPDLDFDSETGLSMKFPLELPPEIRFDKIFRIDAYDPEGAMRHAPPGPPDYLPQLPPREQWFYVRFPVRPGGLRGVKLSDRQQHRIRNFWEGKIGEHYLYVYGDEDAAVRACIILPPFRG